jgi:trk system potassium uptake protein TrkH
MRDTSILNPARFVVIGYLGLIAVGAVFLLMPFASHGVSLIDAFYTATSAVCVTGLIVKDTARDFTLYGKLIILCLIQIGGIGYMTISTAFFYFLSGKISLRDRLLFKESANLLTYDNMGRLAWRIFRITVIAELVGAALLFVSIVQKYPPFQAAGHALFHSVSAFCNAGFSTFSNNLVECSDIMAVPVVIALLIVVGGIGFIVISDLYLVLITKARRGLSLHTKIVLRTTLMLIVAGTCFILLYEGPRSLSHYTFLEKLIYSFFHSVTPRTAGFNTVSIGLFSPVTLILLVVFMYIGASPGGTGGGVKTSTFVLLLMWIKGLFLGRYDEDVVVMKKRIPKEQAWRAVLVIMSSVIFIFISFIVILLLEKSTLLGTIFEIVSAFGTVGLSMGSAVNPLLSLSFDFTWISKSLIIMIMLAGRVGIITLSNALIKPRLLDFQYPKEPIIVG